MKKEYYEYRKLDDEGNMSRDKLEELGLSVLADKVEI